MDILKISPEVWELIEIENSPIQYVGRCQYNLGLGNPYSHVDGSQVQFITQTREKATEYYREWIAAIINNWMYRGASSVFGYERKYLSKVLQLAQDIHNRKITALATYDFHAINYQPVADGQEKAHAEVLYKQCLRIIQFTKAVKMKDCFVHVNNEGTCIKKRSSQDDTFPIQEMKKLVGDELTDSWIECVYNQFNNRDVVIVCDEEFLLKQYIHPTIVTKNYIVIRGCCVIAGLTETSEGKDIGYLSEEECLQVLQELIFLPSSS
jgi:hypothetical protein